MRKPVLFVDGVKPCAKCGESKPPSEFWIRRTMASGRDCYCRSCRNVLAKAEYARNKTTYSDYLKSSAFVVAQKKYAESPGGKKSKFAAHLRRKFGITPEQYEAMYRKQNGACAICHGNNFNGKRLCVDHNHTTNQIRGLLCDTCNYAVGAVREDFKIIESMKDYLELWGRIAAVSR